MEEPEIRPAGPEHFVACHFPGPAEALPVEVAAAEAQAAESAGAVPAVN